MAEREQVRDVLNSEPFQDQAPRQVWARLLDGGRYWCSWRTMYRMLALYAEVRERRHHRRHPEYAKPELLATGPNELWSWDIERHEALLHRAVMKGHRLQSVAAGW